MTYQWKAKETKFNEFTGALLQVDWECIYTWPDGRQSKSSGTACFDPNPNDPNFITRNNLTEEIVIDWVKNVYGEQHVQQIEASLSTGELEPL